MLVKDVVLVLTVLQRNLLTLPWSSRKALTIPKGQLIMLLFRFLEGRINFWFIAPICVPYKHSELGNLSYIISVSNFMRLVSWSTKQIFCDYVFTLCKYLVCELHNFNKTMAFITSNLSFQLHVTECFFKDISVKILWKYIDLYIDLYFRNPYICCIYFFKKTPNYLHD